jgi:hypothetical protein
MRMTDAATLYNEWVRVLSLCNPNLFRVLPGRRDLSFVYNKINQLAPLCGAQMPLQDAPLSEADQETIGVWIDEGAPQN